MHTLTFTDRALTVPDRVIAAVFGMAGGIIATPLLIAIARHAERAAQKRAGMWTA